MSVCVCVTRILRPPLKEALFISISSASGSDEYLPILCSMHVVLKGLDPTVSDASTYRRSLALNFQGRISTLIFFFDFLFFGRRAM